LIDDILDLYRGNRGKLCLRKELVDLAAVVTRAVETCRPLINKRRHMLTVVVPPEPVSLVADASRLEQVLTNLLTNAAKYTDPGGRLWLTAECHAEDVRFRVRDTGIGIAPERLPYIFDLYAQAGGSFAHRQDGIGIGLALVHKLVKAQGGSVSAYSAGVGQGSEFVV